VAALIATVTIFSVDTSIGKNIPEIVNDQVTSKDTKDPSESDKEEKEIVENNAGSSDKVDIKDEDEQKNINDDVTETKSATIPPKLETVRIDDDGTALVAGTAHPGSILEILVDAKVVESIKVGADGNFAFLFDLELKSVPQVISVKSIYGDTQLLADETMIVAPKKIEMVNIAPENKEKEQQTAGSINSGDESSEYQNSDKEINEESSNKDLKVENASTKEIEDIGSDEKASRTINTLSETSIQPPQLAQPTEEKIEKEVQKVLTAEPSVSEINSIGEQPTVLLADKEGIRVAQSSSGPTVMTDVLFDTINYSKDGSVAVTGRGSPDSIVRFYLDNSPVASTSVDQTGYWSADLSDVEAGVYTLRLDQLDQSGKVSSRIESPFKRENRTVLADQLKDMASPARINVITVQPGNTLWAISRERYGIGILYVQVFDANKDKIRNPDLIYPGQIFDLPDDIKVK
jgi:nucleoid-associated protein YgaU